MGGQRRLPVRVLDAEDETQRGITEAIEREAAAVPSVPALGTAFHNLNASLETLPSLDGAKISLTHYKSEVDALVSPPSPDRLALGVQLHAQRAAERRAYENEVEAVEAAAAAANAMAAAAEAAAAEAAAAAAAAPSAAAGSARGSPCASKVPSGSSVRPRRQATAFAVRIRERRAPMTSGK